MPAGHLRGAVYDAVLPSGRIVTPAGTSVVTGMNGLGVALTPDGRFAIVTDDDEREGLVHSLIDPEATGGYLLAVVDTATMRVVDRYRAPNEKFWVGVVALNDPADPARTLVLASGGPSNAVYAFQLGCERPADAGCKARHHAAGARRPGVRGCDAQLSGHDRALARRTPRVRRERRRRDRERDRRRDAHADGSDAVGRLLPVRRGGCGRTSAGYR